MPRNIHLMDAAEERFARDVAIEAANEVARRHGDDVVGEVQFALGLVNLRAAAQIELELCVCAMRSEGVPWADIGALMGMTRQAAQQLFGPAVAAQQASREVDSQEVLTELSVSSHDQ